MRSSNYEYIVNFARGPNYDTHHVAKFRYVVSAISLRKAHVQLPSSLNAMKVEYNVYFTYY